MWLQLEGHQQNVSMCSCEEMSSKIVGSRASFCILCDGHVVFVFFDFVNISI